MSERILSTVAPEDFIGRSSEIETLLRQTKDEVSKRGLLLLSAPALGTSELLKQTYDRLFHEQGEFIPFYFAVKESDGTTRNCVLRFLKTFLTQTVAFHKNDSKILDVAPDIYELAELADASDIYWMERLIETCRNENRLDDELAFVRNCFSAPLRAVANGAKVFVMIDDSHEAEMLTGENNFLEELKEIFSRSTIPFVFAGRRRFLLSAAQTGKTKLTGAEILHLESLRFSDAGLLAENLAKKFDVEISEQTGDLIARQFDGNPTFIKFLFQGAAERKTDLDSFQKVEKLYTDEIFGGRTSKFYDSIFHKIAPEIETQKSILELLYDALTDDEGKTPVENRRDKFNLTAESFHRLMSNLNTHEIVRLTSNLVEAMSENEVLTDYIRARFRLEIAAENRASVIGETMSYFLKRAPKTMAKLYRQKSAVGLRELLSVFNCQELPASLIDYSIFKEKDKGASDGEILEFSKKKTETIRLPQIVYTAYTVAFYPPLNQVTDKERSAVALGFEECAYTDEDETIWIAAEIDSKLEASKDATEFWCDRLEMVALTCNFLKYKIWLVAPEGFAPEAVEILRQRNAYGSSRKQIDLLIKFLDAETVLNKKSPASEYEIVVPMGEDTELIAANTIEEIARRHHFSPKAVNQIKTALVEACINATEHSLSPDRKIYQKFSVEDDKIIITIFNRGLRLADKKTEEISPDEGRRGWGLKLMKTLMDEVKFEQVDDGTRISMTKYLKK